MLRLERQAGVRVDYEENQNDWFISNRPEGNQLHGDSPGGNDARVDGSWFFPQWDGEEAMLKSGLSFFTKEREVDVRRFKYRCGPLSFDPEILYQDPEIFLWMRTSIPRVSNWWR